MSERFWAALFLMCIGFISACGAASPPPNIVFVYADQWRACSMGYSGDPNVKTPNLDRLASQSVNFVNAVSGCPVCTPFRASLMTGQRPMTHGLFLNDAHLSDDAVTIGKVLSKAGYDTGMIGKWHINGRGRMSYIPPENHQGFAYWKVLECSHDYNRSFYYAGDDRTRREWPGYDAFAQTDDACGYIREHAKSAKPFALFMAWGPPHNPYSTAPAEFQAMYDPTAIKLRGNVPAEVAEKTRRELAGYYAHCSALDRCIGQLRQTLHDAGIDKDTILVFTSDHGDMLGSHGMERKQKPWDEALRVPMLWHFPAKLGSEGKRVDAPISSEDLMPTVLSLCGIAIPPSVEGLDFTPLMTDAHAGLVTSVTSAPAALIDCVAPFGEWTRKNGGREFRGVRTPRYTYVRELTGPWLLYDNEKDPEQMQNLVGKPEAAEVQARLEALLRQRLAAAKDEFRPADYYVKKWGYKVNASGTLPTAP